MENQDLDFIFNNNSNRAELNVLVACERSGTVRDEFLNLGFNAYSCDLAPDMNGNTERHFQCDARILLDKRWDLLVVAHPPCTRLCGSGVWALTSKKKQVKGRGRLDLWCDFYEAVDLFSSFLNCEIPRIAIENPVMHGHAKEAIPNYREFSQTVQPWQFGDNESKRTCFWLKGLPNLVPEVTVKPANVKQTIHKMGPSKDRGIQRSMFFQGMARAIAKQWGEYSEQQLQQEAA